MSAGLASLRTPDDIAAEHRLRYFRVAGGAVLPSFGLVVVAAAASHADVRWGLLWWAFAASVVISLAAFQRVQRLGDRLVTPSLVLGIVSLIVLEQALPAPSRPILLLVYGMLAIGVGLLTSGRTRWVLQGMAAVALGAKVQAMTGDPSSTVLQVVGYLVLAVLVEGIADRHRRALLAEAEARRDVAVASRLLVATSSLTDVDQRVVVERLVQAAHDLGFAACGVVQRSPDGMSGVFGDLDAAVLFEVLASSTVADGHAVVPTGDGRDAVVVALPVFGTGDGQAVAVAAPGGNVTDHQARTFAMLVTFAGQATANARRFRDQQQAVRRLSDLDLAKNDFVSSVSHELRTPLTVISGLGQTLLVRRIPLSSPQGQELVTRLDDNAERLARMVETLLDMSRLRRRGTRVQRQATDVSAVVGAVVRRLDMLSGRHRLECRLDVGLYADADAAMLEHVLENLISNAVKHTPPGTSVEVSVRRFGHEVRIAVSDDGPGIPAAELPRLTDRFFRGGDPMRRRTSGLGLGLSLVDDILQAHGSRLDVRSVVGQGASFSFGLALVPAPDEEERVPS